ncbi:MAG: UrcA family protein [Pseudomonadota bacterium]
MAVLKIAFATVATAIAATSIAHASPQFAYKSYELETDGGAKAVYKRMQRQAVNACRAQTGTFVRQTEVKTCADDLVDTWVDGTQNLRLKRIHTS